MAVADHQNLRRRKHQEPIFLERTVARQFDMSQKTKIEKWLAGLLIDDFLRREGLMHLKEGGAAA